MENERSEVSGGTSPSRVQPSDVIDDPGMGVVKELLTVLKAISNDLRLVRRELQRVSLHYCGRAQTVGCGKPKCESPATHIATEAHTGKQNAFCDQHGFSDLT